MSHHNNYAGQIVNVLQQATLSLAIVQDRTPILIHQVRLPHEVPEQSPWPPPVTGTLRWSLDLGDQTL